MAITWGSGSGSGNPHYVGIDVEVGATSATVRLYAKAQYSVSDGQTMSWSNAASGSKTFTHSQSGGSAVLVASFSVTGTASQTKTISASLSGAYNGGSPSHSVSWTFPAPGIVAPNPPTAVYMSTDGQTTATVGYATSAPAANRPVGHYRIERYDWSIPAAGYVFQGATTSTSALFTNLYTNRQYSYRVAAINDAGSSEWAYSVPRQTTPYAPAPVTLGRTSGGALSASWGDTSPWNSVWDVVFEAGGVPSAAVEVPKASRTLAKASPDPMVSHRVGVRSRTANGLTSAYTWSNTLTLLAKPNPPSAVSGGVADPAFPVEQSWVHGTVDGSAQTMFQAQWRPSGSSGSWTLGAQVASAAQRSTWPAGTFTVGTDIEVQIRTKGAHASWSDWSATSAWLWDTTPVAAIVKPGPTYASTTMVAEWTSSVAQSQWRTVLMDAAGFALETLTGSGATLRAAFKYRLVSGVSYRVSVETRSPGGLWSAPVERLVAVTFPAPALVLVSVTWDAVNGWAQCAFVAAPARTYELAADGSSVEKDGTGMVLRRNLASSARDAAVDPAFLTLTTDGTRYFFGRDTGVKLTAGRTYTISWQFSRTSGAVPWFELGTGPSASGSFSRDMATASGNPKPLMADGYGSLTFTPTAADLASGYEWLGYRLRYSTLATGVPSTYQFGWLKVEEGSVATAHFSEKTPSTVIPHEVDLYRSDKGAAGPWELVAENVPLDGTTIIDTEPAVDGSAVWVARARNTVLGTEADGRMATTEITSETGYLSAGPGYETVTALKWGPDTTLTVTRPRREVIYLDGGTRPRRVLVDTPEKSRKLAFSGRLIEGRDEFEELAAMDGPHLYRDPDGRKLYGGLSDVPVGRGTKALWWDIGFSVDESDHDAIYGEVVPS